MIDFRMRGAFFDRPAVEKAIGKARKQELSKAGGLVRKTAQRSMRYATKKGRLSVASKPGEPPRAIRPHPWLRQHLYYSYDAATKSVVVGPARFGRATGAPRALEFGGTVRRRNPRRIYRKPGDGGEIALGPGHRAKPVKDHHGNVRLVTYTLLRTAEQAARANRLNEELYGPWELPGVKVEARPYMGPALKKTAPEMPNLWADSIH